MNSKEYKNLIGKKILVLTASPKKNGNTNKMADAFIRGAEQAGHSVFKFETAFKKIGGCNACNTCWSTGTACSVKDDFNELESLLESCDVLLISSPLYWFAFPAQIKGAIDKLYAYGGSGGPRPLTIKESYLFICGGDADKEEYKPVIMMYQMMSEYLGWKDRGILQNGGVNGEGEIEQSGVLEQAEEMGRGV